MALPPKTAHWPGYRWPHLLNLTEALLRNERWPQTDRWLAAQFREHKAFGRKDRRFYSDAIFRLCREAAAAVWLQHLYLGKSLDWDRDDVWHRLRDVNPAELWSWLVLLDGADAQLPREIEDATRRRAFLSALDQEQQALVGRLQQGWLPSWQNWLKRRQTASNWNEPTLNRWQAMQQERPPLWLRLVPGCDTEAVESLQAEGFVILSRDGLGLSIEADSRLTRSEAWEKGWLDIQDKASQRIVEAVQAQPGERIWDLCAGAGGKALALAMAVGPDGHILASDIRGHALDQAEQRARRLDIQHLQTQVLDATDTRHVAPLDGMEFDAVLIDAPCTGAGTWRRSPDGRWRLTQALLRELNQLQDQLLNKAHSPVAKGGRLVYATCSWLVEENEDRVAAFLVDHPEFELETQGIVGAPDEDADTMFVAILRKA